MQDLQSIVLGVIAGLLTNYVQKWLKQPKGEEKDAEKLTSQFFVCLICLTFGLLILPNISGKSWYMTVTKVVITFIISFALWGCIYAFTLLRKMVKQSSNTTAKCHSQQNKKKRTKRHK